MHTKTIRQSVNFKANPHNVYQSLIDSDKHTKFTGSQVSISRKTGSKFNIYGGDMGGVNLEIVTGHKIVQSWRYSNWPEKHRSTVTFLFFT